MSDDILTEDRILNHRFLTYYVLVITSEDYKDSKLISVFSNKRIFKWYVDFIKSYKDELEIKVDKVEYFYTKSNIFDNYEILDEKEDLRVIPISIEEFENNILGNLVKISKIIK